MSPPMTPLAGDTSLATIQSQPLRASLALACSTTFSVSAANPITRPRPPGLEMRHGREDVRVLDQRQRRRAAAALLELLAAAGRRCASPRPRRRTRATSAGSARSTAASISRALSTLTTLHAWRVGNVHRPRHQRHLGAGRCGGRGDGVALLAGRAVGDVAHRIDRLVGRPGGDQHAPAGERDCGAARSSARPRPRSRAVRPCGRRRPRRSPPSRRRSGRSTRRRRRRAAPDCGGSRRAATCADSSPARSAPCLSVASRTVEARSSAWPFAIFAIRSAVAGATTIRSVSRASRIWPTSNSLAASNKSVKACSPASAPADSGVTNCCAAAVITTRTAAPRSRSRRIRSSAL